MADGFYLMVNDVTASLSNEERKTLQYLCEDLSTSGSVDDLRGALLSFNKRRQIQTGQSQTGDALLMELMFRIKRFDILKKVLSTNKQQVEGILQKGTVLSDYRVLMADLSENLEHKELQSITFLLRSTLPKERLSKATSFLDVVVELEKSDEVSCDNLQLIKQCLENIRRMDLVKRIQAFQNKGRNVPCAVSKVPKPTSSNYAFGHHQCPVVPVRKPQCCTQQFKTLKLSVPETGTQHKQAFMEEYQINPELRGLCVIIDCVGFDGETLKQTFERLGFRVIFHSLLGLKETQKVLEDLAHHRCLQTVSSFACCLISRGSDTHLLATDSHSTGIFLEDLKQLFGPIQCPSLGGKPKLFFTQIYKSVEVQIRPSLDDDDEFIETDAPSNLYARHRSSERGSETLPVSADVLWSLSTTEAKLLEGSGHRSVYLQALNSALLKGCQGKMHMLDVMTEVNKSVFNHNQQNLEKMYQLQLSHTLRKKLYF